MAIQLVFIHDYYCKVYFTLTPNQGTTTLNIAPGYENTT